MFFFLDDVYKNAVLCIPLLSSQKGGRGHTDKMISLREQLFEWGIGKIGIQNSANALEKGKLKGQQRHFETRG